jgi:hypothetical protein
MTNQSLKHFAHTPRAGYFPLPRIDSAALNAILGRFGAWLVRIGEGATHHRLGSWNRLG